MRMDEVLYRNGYPAFSPAEIERRHQALRERIAARSLDGLIVYGTGRFHSDMLYLSNWPGGREGLMILPVNAEPTLLVELYNHVPLARRLSLIADTHWGGTDLAETTAEILKTHAGAHRAWGLVGAMPWTVYERLAARLGSIRLVPFPDYLTLRLIRSDEELAWIRKAAAVTDRGVAALAAAMKPGMREWELAAVLEMEFLRAGGYSGIHFLASTAMADPEAYVPHQYQSERRLGPGDIVIGEISGAFWGYSGQIHRSFILQDCMTAEYADLHAAAVAAYEAVESVLTDGATVGDVVERAEVIAHSGYVIVDDLLHGLNQSTPIVRTRQQDHGTNPIDFVFRENMVVTLQPHLVSPDRRRGLQFGETVRITRGRVERLHKIPRQPFFIQI